MKKQTERTIYLVALISGVLSLYLNYTLLPVIMVFLGLAYLTLGWHLLNPEKERRFDFVYFWTSFSFAWAFLTLIFNFYEWSLLRWFQYASILFLVLAMILMSEIKRIKEKGIVEIFIKTMLLVALVVFSMIVD
ncbi:MAG: hypothetical protein U9N72_02210 [Bacteroidota bacterium]|nr:hypothetical protein [Bacteroidota bacterium]